MAQTRVSRAHAHTHACAYTLTLGKTEWVSRHNKALCFGLKF